MTEQLSLSLFTSPPHLHYMQQGKLSFSSARASLVAQLVKNPLAMWETWVQSLGWEDPLEKGKASHYSIPAWRIPWTEEPSQLHSMGL